MKKTRFTRALYHLSYTFRVIHHHPLTKDRRLAAWKRWLGWQVGSRLVPGPVAVPFVNQTKLLVAPGMYGATLNVYVGLGEFEDMSFLLHFLRPSDLFVDVGASVGAYTVLASGAVGCRSLAFEPTQQSFQSLQANVMLNAIGHLVAAHPVAVGAEEGKAAFTVGLDTLNHIVLPGQRSDHKVTEVEITTLDAELADRKPVLIKIDVEGFELAVLSGAQATIQGPSLQAIIVEIGDSADRYGTAREQTFEAVTDFGFVSCVYDPLSRQLTEIGKERWMGAGLTNTIFVRDVKMSKGRLEAARSFSVLGRQI